MLIHGIPLLLDDSHCANDSNLSQRACENEKTLIGDQGVSATPAFGIPKRRKLAILVAEARAVLDDRAVGFALAFRANMQHS